MFTANDLYDRIKQRPFRPLRLKTSDDESYEIFHPEMIMVGRRDVTVGTATAEDPVYYDRVSRISILHITALEDLPAPRPVGGNGEQ